MLKLRRPAANVNAPLTVRQLVDKIYEPSIERKQAAPATARSEKVRPRLSVLEFTRKPVVKQRLMKVYVHERKILTLLKGGVTQ